MGEGLRALLRLHGVVARIFARARGLDVPARARVLGAASLLVAVSGLLSLLLVQQAIPGRHQISSPGAPTPSTPTFMVVNGAVVPVAATPTWSHGAGPTPAGTPGATTTTTGTPLPSPTTWPGAEPTATTTTWPTPSVCPPGSWCPPPVTPTPYVAIDNSHFIRASAPSLVAAGAVVTIDFIVENTGTTTWKSQGYTGHGYSLDCLATCQGADLKGLESDVTPGEQFDFQRTLQAPVLGTHATYRTQWTLEHDGVAFGDVFWVDFTVEGWYTVLRQAAPGCNNAAGASWEWWQGAGNSIDCTASGLVMQQGSSTPPEINLTSAPGGYNRGFLQASVHVHFANPASVAGAGIAVQVAPTGQCGAVRLEVRPDGHVLFVQQFVATDGTCVYPTYTVNVLPAATDFDVLVNVDGGSGEGWVVNGQYLGSGGIRMNGGPVGLLVDTATPPSGNVTFSNFVLQQYG